MSEYIVRLDSKHSIALKLAFVEEMRGGDFVREEIVRCRDCEHFTNDSEHGAWCNWFMRSLHDDYDGFCAWGERKEGA